MYVTPSRLPEADQRACADAVAKLRCTRTAGRPIHAEVRLNERGAWVIEVAPRSIAASALHAALRRGRNAGRAGLASGGATGPDVVAARAATQRRDDDPDSAWRHAGRVAGLNEARAVPGIEGVTISIPCGEDVVPLPRGDRYLGFIYRRGDARRGRVRAPGGARPAPLRHRVATELRSRLDSLASRSPNLPPELPRSGGRDGIVTALATGGGCDKGIGPGAQSFEALLRGRAHPHLPRGRHASAVPGRWVRGSDDHVAALQPGHLLQRVQGRPTLPRLHRMGGNLVGGTATGVVRGRARLRKRAAGHEQGWQAARVRGLRRGILAVWLAVSDHNRLERAKHQPPHRLGKLAQAIRAVRHRPRGDGRGVLRAGVEAPGRRPHLGHGAKRLHGLVAWHLDLPGENPGAGRPPGAVPGGAASSPDLALQLPRGHGLRSLCWIGNHLSRRPPPGAMLHRHRNRRHLLRASRRGSAPDRARRSRGRAGCLRRMSRGRG